MRTWGTWRGASRPLWCQWSLESLDWRSGAKPRYYVVHTWVWWESEWWCEGM